MTTRCECKTLWAMRTVFQMVAEEEIGWRVAWGVDARRCPCGCRAVFEVETFLGGVAAAKTTSFISTSTSSWLKEICEYVCDSFIHIHGTWNCTCIHRQPAFQSRLPTSAKSVKWSFWTNKPVWRKLLTQYRSHLRSLVEDTRPFPIE